MPCGMGCCAGGPPGGGWADADEWACEHQPGKLESIIWENRERVKAGISILNDLCGPERVSNQACGCRYPGDLTSTNASTLAGMPCRTSC